MHIKKTAKQETKPLYPDLSYTIVGACYKAHNDLGRFCRERQYGDVLEKLFKGEGVRYVREFDLRQLGKKIEGNIVDFIVEDKILLDLKAKRIVTKEDYYQMVRYLQSSGLTLGLIVNFRSVYLSPKRVVNFN